MTHKPEGLDAGALLPCPFCGARRLHKVSAKPEEQRDPLVWCTGCAVEMPATNLDAAIAKWNTRAALPSVGDGERDALKIGRKIASGIRPWCLGDDDEYRETIAREIAAALSLRAGDDEDRVLTDASIEAQASDKQMARGFIQQLLKLSALKSSEIPLLTTALTTLFAQARLEGAALSKREARSPNTEGGER